MIFLFGEIDVFIVGGLLGSLAKIIVESDGQFIFPKIICDPVTGRRVGITLGFIGNIFIGILTAVCFDNSFIVAVF